MNGEFEAVGTQASSFTEALLRPISPLSILSTPLLFRLQRSSPGEWLWIGSTTAMYAKKTQLYQLSPSHCH